MAFMCLVPHPDGVPEVRILHRFMRYLVDLPGEQPTGFHDRVLALLGNVRPNQYPVVDIPNTAFHLAGVGGVRVPTAAAMDSIIAEWVVDNQNLGPYPEADATTVIVRPRHIQLLPTRYAALLVHRDGLSPKAAYTELAGAIHVDGIEVACADVLTWLRTAFTARGGGGPQPDDSILLHAFPAVHLPLLVYTYVSAKVAADLPALRPRDAVGDAGLVQAQLALLAAGRGPAAPSDGDRGERGPKTVREAYKEAFPLLPRTITKLKRWPA